MSSMRNAVQRRNHKERAQPIEREKWGLLEKRKDYKLRAANHKEKKQKIKLLKQKVLEKNPDEFSFAMMNASVDKAGRKVADRGNVALSMDVVKLLKTQDAGYIRNLLQIVRKEKKEMEQKILVENGEVKQVADSKDGKKGDHTVFVGDRKEQSSFEKDEWFGKGESFPQDPKETVDAEDSEDDEWEKVKPKKLSKKQQEAKLLAEKQQRAMARSRERTQERMAIHLEAIKARERDLLTVEAELEKQRAKMNNTVGGTNKHGVKFKVRERKR